MELRTRIEELKHAPIAPLGFGLGHVVHPSPVAFRMGMGGIEAALGVDIHPAFDGKARLRSIALGAELFHGRLQGHVHPLAKRMDRRDVLFKDIALRMPTVAVGALDALGIVAEGIP